MHLLFFGYQTDWCYLELLLWGLILGGSIATKSPLLPWKVLRKDTQGLNYTVESSIFSGCTFCNFVYLLYQFFMQFFQIKCEYLWYFKRFWGNIFAKKHKNDVWKNKVGTKVASFFFRNCIKNAESKLSRVFRRPTSKSGLKCCFQGH